MENAVITEKQDFCDHSLVTRRQGPRDLLHTLFLAMFTTTEDDTMCCKCRESNKTNGTELKMRETQEVINAANFMVITGIFFEKKPDNTIIKPPMIGNHRAKESIGTLTIFNPNSLLGRE